MDITDSTMIRKSTQQTVLMGRAQMTSVPSLSANHGDGNNLLALGNMAVTNAANLAILERSEVHQAPVELIDCLVVGTLCDLEKLFNTIRCLKDIHPALKVVLVDSKENPRLSDQPLPFGVEAVMLVSQEKGEIGKSLLFQQSGILAGINAGMAAFIAFVMETQLESPTTIAMATTNLSPELFHISP